MHLLRASIRALHDRCSPCMMHDAMHAGADGMQAMHAAFHRVLRFTGKRASYQRGRETVRTVQNCPDVVSVVTFVMILTAVLSLGNGCALAAMAEKATKQREAIAHLLAMAGLRSHHRDTTRIGVPSKAISLAGLDTVHSHSY